MSSHWVLVHNAILEAEKVRGRYLTLPELQKIHEEAPSKQLTPVELRAMKRIWPGFELKFNLERHRG